MVVLCFMYVEVSMGDHRCTHMTITFFFPHTIVRSEQELHTQIEWAAFERASKLRVNMRA